MKIKNQSLAGKLLLFTIATGISLTSSGCATIGNSFQFDGPESVVVGETTKAEVLAHYGNPFRVGYENGHLKWTYGYYQYRLFGSSDTRDLSITFDKHNVVENYTYSSSDSDEIKKMK